MNTEHKKRLLATGSILSLFLAMNPGCSHQGYRTSSAERFQWLAVDRGESVQPKEKPTRVKINLSNESDDLNHVWASAKVVKLDRLGRRTSVWASGSGFLDLNKSIPSSSDVLDLEEGDYVLAMTLGQYNGLGDYSHEFKVSTGCPKSINATFLCSLEEGKLKDGPGVIFRTGEFSEIGF